MVSLFALGTAFACVPELAAKDDQATTASGAGGAGGGVSGSTGMATSSGSAGEGGAATTTGPGASTGSGGMTSGSGSSSAAGSGGSGPQCTPAESLCDNACVDVKSDPKHCGKCDNACASGVPQCLNGKCVAKCIPTFVFKTSLSMPGGAVVWDVAAGDLDGDGRPELIAGSTGALCVFRNSSNGFGACEAYSLIGDRAYLAVGDFSGDGIPDVVASGYNALKVTPFVNDGKGKLVAQPTLSTPQTPLDLRVSDVNGDGKADIVTTNLNSGSISVFMNKGGGFDAAVNYAVFPGGGANSMAIGDLNGDGRPDVAVVTYDAVDKLSVLMNKGDGTFLAPVHYPAADNPGGVDIVDVDADGLPDLVTSNGVQHTFSVFRNLGGGSFGVKMDQGVGDDPSGVEGFDANKDGLPDLLIELGQANGVSLVLNKGNGTFEAAQTVTTPGVGWPAQTLDFDGDKHIDVAVGHYNAGTISLLMNQCK